MTHWSQDAIFYALYPLGQCGAPASNDLQSTPVERLDSIKVWIDHIQETGFNALYLGPLFESMSHGYDTVDYSMIDRRLGNKATLRSLVHYCHERGIRVILDGVFNHVGRGFFAFQDILTNREGSPYRDWFSGLRFDHNNTFGDGLSYEGWAGHESLVKLNLKNADVRGYLIHAVEEWISDYDIDGLRLDAADVVDKDFLSELAQVGRSIKPELWLMGEVVHGDYRHWANPARIDSVTNYELYIGLYSSHNDANYFEIAYALNRQSGETGIYKDLALFNFVDNHDVERVASSLKNPAHLFPLYALLFAIPGIPSVYYGSEFGVTGKKTRHSDSPLRPSLDLSTLKNDPQYRGLREWIAGLICLRKDIPALRHGNYRQVHVGHQQYAFLREAGDQAVLVAVNSADEAIDLDLLIPGDPVGTWQDLITHEINHFHSRWESLRKIAALLRENLSEGILREKHPGLSGVSIVSG